MFESEDDRLALIQSLGGQCVRAENGEFSAVFDNEFVEELGIEGTVPVINCRTSDAMRLRIDKGHRLTVAGKVYQVSRLEPDGTGMTRMVLA